MWHILVICGIYILKALLSFKVTAALFCNKSFFQIIQIKFDYTEKKNVLTVFNLYDMS